MNLNQTSIQAADSGDANSPGSWLSPNTSHSCSLNTSLTLLSPQTSPQPTSRIVARTTVCSPRAGYALSVASLIWLRLENAPPRAAETLHNLSPPHPASPHDPKTEPDVRDHVLRRAASASRRSA